MHRFLVEATTRPLTGERMRYDACVSRSDACRGSDFTCAVALALAAASSPCVANAANANAERPNLFVLEMGGRGLGIGVEYERWMFGWGSLGIGIAGAPAHQAEQTGAFCALDCGTLTGPSFLVLLVPLWASAALPLDEVQSIVVSMGGTVLLPWASRNVSSVFWPNAGLAYQLHLHGGFVLRPGVDLFFTHALSNVVTSIGLQIGWSF